MVLWMKSLLLKAAKRRVDDGFGNGWHATKQFLWCLKVSELAIY